MTKILFLAPYPLHQAPSQRFRFEQYFNLLEKQGFQLQFQSFFSYAAWLKLYSEISPLYRIAMILKGLTKRIFILFLVPSQNFVFIHRELAPVGPPVFEWIIARVFRKKIIYDFDDAIWLTDKKEGRLGSLVRWRSKVKSICRWSYRISCGNQYLAGYAQQFNPSVVVNPTTIDTENLHNPALVRINKNPERVVVGWTGSHSTLKYLAQLISVLQEIEQEFPQVDFLIVADRDPNLPLRRCIFMPWKKETEAEDLARMDIGIMPLPDDEWTRGKCGFKALQYMAMEIPCVASPVGVNTEIIDHGKNGFLATIAQEWKSHLSSLITDESLRKKIGKAGRSKVIAHYSVTSNSNLFLSLFV